LTLIISEQRVNANALPALSRSSTKSSKEVVPTALDTVAVTLFLYQQIAVARLLDKLLIDQIKSRASHGR
jgi:hypothetical protein